MARPATNSLTYFSTDVLDGDNLQYIEAIHGLTGYAIVHKLWKHIYGGEYGYFSTWKELNQQLFCKKTGISMEQLNAVLSTCFLPDIAIFNRDMYDRYHILTSSGVQKRWKHITTLLKRKNCVINPEYYCIKAEENSDEAHLLHVETLQTTGINSTSDVVYDGKPHDEMPQRKGKEKKVNENKGDNAAVPPSTPVLVDKLKKFVPPTEAEAKEYFRSATAGTWRPELADMEAKKFIAFYESKGWKVGREKMVNWHASASGWILRELGDGYKIKDGRVIKSQVDAVSVPKTGQELEKEVEYLYQRFLENDLRRELLKPQHYQLLKDRHLCEFADDVKNDIIDAARQQRIQDLTGTNDGAKNRLRAAFEEKGPIDQEPIKSDKTFFQLTKCFAILQVFQEASLAGRPVLMNLMHQRA